MTKHIPNPLTWRPPLGPEYVTALTKIAEKLNADVLQPIGVLDWLRKMIRHWWNATFPAEAFPGDVSGPPYNIGIEQSAQADDVCADCGRCHRDHVIMNLGHYFAIPHRR